MRWRIGGRIVAGLTIVAVFTAFGRKMKGLQLDYTLGRATLTAIASKLEGDYVYDTGGELEDQHNASDAQQPKEDLEGHVDSMVTNCLTSIYADQHIALSLRFLAV